MVQGIHTGGLLRHDASMHICSVPRKYFLINLEHLAFILGTSLN